VTTPAPIHDAAAQGFERGAADYDKGRPGYPAEVLDVLEGEGVLPAGGRPVVVDLAAGTGKFTRRLFERVADVIAVEPVAAMRSAYAANFPGRPVLSGTAECLPLDDGTADVVAVAQAFHWFDAGAALEEIARVLQPGGWLVLVWNTRDERSPWTAQIGAVMDRLAGDAPRFRSTDQAWRAAIEAHPAFESLRGSTFDNPVPVDLETMLARVSSTSYVSALPDAERAAVLDEVTALLEAGPIAAEGPNFVERYRTELFWCRRR
jgi:SAM-dependent methyltransferase